ncbi:hypothetical protein [Ralstonia sp.]|uniref:hypothetical protein n=1 Tax=Ralstonia sp. TaxID=54061 RepID=UPI0031DC6702
MEFEITMAGEAPSAVSESDLEATEQKGALVKELIALDAAFYEDYQQRLNASSRQGIECFMTHNAGVSVPMLSAESSGAILATWSKGENHISLRFIDRYTMHFAIAQGRQRSWGEAHPVTFLATHPEATDIIA